jgi:diamine N-acetyltransferase
MIMKKHTNARTLKIKEILDDQSFGQLYRLIEQLNPGMRKSDYKAMLSDVRESGLYRCLGVWKGKKLVGACGLWTMTRFWCGKFMEMDNLVIDRDQRNAGIGKLLVAHVEKLAQRESCKVLLAASYSHNYASHRFYFRENYIIKGYVFYKELGKS